MTHDHTCLKCGIKWTDSCETSVANICELCGKRAMKQRATMVKVTIRLPHDLVKQLKHKAVDEDVDMQSLIITACRKSLERFGTS